MPNNINRYDPILPPVYTGTAGPVQSRNVTGSAFKEVLQQKLSTDTIKFSQHCQKRMEQNHIYLDQQQVDKLNSAVDKAETKGARESCVIMEDMVFIVNVASRTVKTIVEEQRMKDNVFTNIDSAVII